MIASRIIPPPIAVTHASTTTPKMSSRTAIPTAAPSTANTRVAARSNPRSSFAPLPSAVVDSRRAMPQHR